MKTLIVFLSFLMTTGPISAQTSKGGTTPKTTMSDLYNKDDGGACYPRETPTLSGTIIKRQYDDDELTLIGFVLRSRGDKRTYVNIDHEYVSGKGRFVPEELLQLVKPRKQVKIWVYGCGASGRLLMLEKIQSL